MAAEQQQEQMQWYIVQTYSGHENKAKLALEDRIKREKLDKFFDQVFIPTEQVTEVRNGKKRQVTKKFYNGYIFVKMMLNETTWHCVKNTNKIVGFLGNPRNPPPVPEEQVKRIEQRIEEGSLNTTTSYNFSSGDKVRIIEGNFKDFTGMVEEVNEEKEQLRVYVEIFGRPTAIEFSFDQVLAAED